MRRNFSKFKTKLSKGTEQRNEVYGVTGSSKDTGRVGQGRDFCVYNVTANQAKHIRDRAPADDKSSTAYDTFTSSTSESDPDRLFHLDRRYKEGKEGRKYREDPEVCITVPEEGKGKGGVRIVANASRTKQVEFASVDAVYGTPTTSVVSSEDENTEPYGKERIRVYRAEGKDQNAFLRERESSSSPRRDDGVIHEDETNKTTEAKCSPKNSRMQPALTTPLISVNIETSQEEMHRGEIGNETYPNTNSRLMRMKQRLLENKNVGSEVNGTVAGMHVKSEETKVQTKIGNAGSKSANQVYYVESEGRDEAQIQGALKQLLSMINQGQVNNGLTQPLTYVATVDGTNILSLQRIESSGQNKVSVSKISPKSSPKNIVVKKSSSRQSTKNKLEVGSKIVLKRSKMSILKSSIPKPSSKIIRKSSLAANQNSGSLKRDGSNKYEGRDVIVIPEETFKHSTDIYQTKPNNNDIPEETIMLTEREIKSHIFEDAPSKPANVGESKKTDSIQIQQILPSRKSSENYNQIENTPCLYYCSTSAIDRGTGNKSNKVNEVKPEVEEVQRGVTSDSSLGSTSRQRHTGDERNKTGVQDKPNTIVIDDETHKEIMEAIEATSGKECIISLPTKISRRVTNGNQLSIKAKRSDNQLSIVRRISDEVIPREAKDNAKRVSFKKSSLGKREIKANIEDNGTRKQSFGNHELDASNVNPFTGKAFAGNNAEITAYPMQLNPYGNTPMRYESFDNDSKILSKTGKRKTSFTKEKPTPNPQKEDIKESTGARTILSYSEPVIQEDSQNSIGRISLGGGKKTSKLRRSNAKTSTTYGLQTPGNMVYVGRLPNTTYNVFFSPDAASQPAKTKGPKKTKSDTTKLRPIRSKKLLAEGPKAILIFVNKKTELNRNPFDGNVIYESESDYYMQKGKGRKKPKDRDGKDKYGKGRRKPKGGTNDGTDFDVTSWRDPNRYDDMSGRSDRPIVERSPSGMKTVVKFPCGCMKITKVDPETGSVTEETTSAFCTLGSRCDIGQSQKDKRVIRYAEDSMDYGDSSFDRTMTYGRVTGGDRGPDGRGFPQLDIVLEGIVSKKPIPERQPAPTMKGANLTGTLTIKTNRCNGVFNFYLDPRIKRCLASKLACLTDGNYSTTATIGGDNYSRRTSYSRQ